MYPGKGRSTMKQMAYARQILGAKGKNKKQIALDVGYSPSTANSIVDHIESKPGFNNAMMKLAYESNNLALAALHEFKSRGFSTFTNNELTGALNAIAGAWSRFNAASPMEKSNNTSNNKLRTIILQQVENQTISAPKKEVEVVEVESIEQVVLEDEVPHEEDPNDF